MHLVNIWAPSFLSFELNSQISILSLNNLRKTLKNNDAKKENILWTLETDSLTSIPIRVNSEENHSRVSLCLEFYCIEFVESHLWRRYQSWRKKSNNNATLEKDTTIWRVFSSKRFRKWQIMHGRCIAIRPIYSSENSIATVPSFLRRSFWPHLTLYHTSNSESCSLSNVYAPSKTAYQGSDYTTASNRLVVKNEKDRLRHTLGRCTCMHRDCLSPSAALLLQCMSHEWERFHLCDIAVAACSTPLHTTAIHGGKSLFVKTKSCLVASSSH